MTRLLAIAVLIGVAFVLFRYRTNEKVQKADEGEVDGSGGALQSRKDKQVANLSSIMLLNIPLYVLVNDK